MDKVRVTTLADLAIERYGVRGKGVTVVVLDRGIDWRHPDFRKPNGTTRIKWLLDMSGQSYCSAGNPAPAEYSEAQINAALGGGAPIPSTDFVGHGNATAGSAAGNGRAFAGGRYRGMAPEADLLIVKLVSEGAPAAAGNPPETRFVGCIDAALDWVDQKITALGQPAVGIMNIGTQAGPNDGTSAISRKIDQVFGLDRPGRVFIAPGGDEGGLPSHSGGTFTAASPGRVRFSKESGTFTVAYLWYSGNVPADVTVALDGGESIGPVAPGAAQIGTNIQIYHYTPSNAPYPVTSTSGDRSVGIVMRDTSGTGTVTIQARGPGEGRFDLYTDIAGDDFLTPNVTLLDHLVDGRLSDVGSTRGAIISADFMNRNRWIDLDGFPRDLIAEGNVDDLWIKSPGGPTRDGRFPGVDVASPGEVSFVTASKQSYWGTLRGNLVQDGGGFYGRFGGNSGAAPIITGAVALLLELDPTLTGREVRDILRESAITDSFTGAVPNRRWGYGKLNVLGALDRVACRKGDRLCLNEGRFSVKVDWRDFQGQTGVSQVVPLGSDDSGLLWFFSADNWEMLVKILDGCGLNNKLWVFAAATTTVEYSLQVIDTHTGQRVDYHNPLGNASDAIVDTSAFDTCGASSLGPPPRDRVVDLGQSHGERQRSQPPSSEKISIAGAAGSCVPGDTALCLNGGRFRVELDWVDFQGGRGAGRRVPLGSDDSGLLWFFDPDNWEMLLKVLDGCDLNGHFWAFAAATTNVEYTLRFTDTVTGAVKSYTNPSGRAAPALADTSAFPCI